MQKPKIAFIDDEERILRSLKMHFRQSHDVFITTDPKKLMDYIAANDVAVVISDQRMPNMKGTEVLSHVKTISPHTIRILLTGYADLNAVIDSVNDGEIYRYITKPWQNEDLKRIVNKATEIAQRTRDVAHDVESALSSQSTEAYEVGARHVLVLDDHRETYEQIRNHFEPAFKISWASTLEQASELLQRKKFGVVIADITLGDDNIVPVIYALKNLQPDLMVLMLTEIEDAHMIIDLINKGQIYRCLPRPTNLTIMGISMDRAYRSHIKMLENPILAQRHHVEEVPEAERFSFSSKLKSFFTRFGWGSNSSKKGYSS